MAFYTMFSIFVLAILSTCTGVMEEEHSSTIKCQFGRSLRKQIDVTPLNGVCLRDIVMHLSKHLQNLSHEELGAPQFQGMLDKLDFVDSIISLKSRLDEITKNLNDKLKKYTDILSESNSLIQPVLLKQQHDIYSSSQSENRPLDTCSRIIDALASKLHSQDWKNLHILPVSQPGTMCGPPSLVHNIGPLLLSQCNRSKNVILLLEHSAAFMSDEDVTHAQIIAKTIVHMLSDTDRVTVVGLAGRGSVLCSDQGLPQATDIHKIRLDRHVDSLDRSSVNQTFKVDVTDFVKNISGEVILIHLTNNMKDSPKIDRIVESMKAKGVNVLLRTILILTNQQPHTNNKEYAVNGTVITLPTQHVLGYEIAKLFAGLHCNKEDMKSYYISDPYFEPYSKAMTVSVGQITNTALLSYNVKLHHFVEDITYFESGGHQVHALLVDKKGVIWMHKNFPRMETLDEQPLKVYLHDIENLDEKVMTEIGMIDQPEGIVEVRSLLGSKKQIYWRHLNYSDLMACLIATRPDEDSTRLPFARSAPAQSTNILHHRLDLVSKSRDALCWYNGRLASFEAATVYLSPWCFKSPAEQSRHMENSPAVTVQSYMAYLKDTTRLLTNPGLQESVKAEVAMLAQILQHFKNRQSSSLITDFIAQRYLASVKSGVLEVYPGVMLGSDLDPKRRPWYLAAMRHPGRLVLSPAYLDAAGSGFVVSMSLAMHEGRSVGFHSNKDPIVAVMGIDFTLGYVARMLYSLFPVCGENNVRCFLMDDRGYLIYHPTLLLPADKVEGQHLTNKELLVANDILNHDLFVSKKMCSSHLDGTSQRYYQFNVSLDEVLTNIVHGEHCVMYQLAVVPGTNVFLGVVNTTCKLPDAFCPCSTSDRSCLNCDKMEQTDCECPCECYMYTTDCRASKPADAEFQHEACEALIEQGSSLASTTNSVLRSCKPTSCRSYASRSECLGIVGCQWCEIEADAEISATLPEPFCSDVGLCFRGVYGSSPPYGDATYNSQATEELIMQEWPSVGPFAGGILSLVILFGVGLFCYKLRTVSTGLEHECLHNLNSPDTLRMTHLDCDADPSDLDLKANMDSALLRDIVTPISPYRVSTNYRRPHGGDSDHGYSTMTPHDDSEHQNFSEPLLVLAGSVTSVGKDYDIVRSTSSAILDSPANSTSTTGTIVAPPSPTTNLGSSPHRVIATVDVHCNMETNYC